VSRRGGGTDPAGHGVAAGPTSRHLSTVRPNIIAFTPRKVARFSAEGHQRGIAMPAQGNSRVGTYLGIGNASTAGIPSFSATWWPTTT
jgi:hypothetical protein